jgi:DNA polymerase delta subunit 1
MSAWQRKLAAPLNCSKAALDFQQLEIDTYTIRKQNIETPVLRLYGVTKNGHSAMAHVHGFRPYFYAGRADRAGVDTSSTARLKALLNKHLAKGQVLQITTVCKKSIYGYDPNPPVPVYKIVVDVDGTLNRTRALVEQLEHWHLRAYESNIKTVLRFMIDHDIVGCSWVTLPAGQYRLRDTRRASRCQYEADINVAQLVSHKPVGEWEVIAPLRVLSFDIECMGRPGIFPDAKHDPVIQIASVLTEYGNPVPIASSVLTLDTCNPIYGCEVRSFDTEEKLLLAWSRLVSESDPDIITGYNIQNFDVPYLINRAETINARSFPYLGRLCNTRTTLTLQTFSSNAYGTRESFRANMEGRVMYDMLLYMQRSGPKMRYYTLNNVCALILGDQKEDVHHSKIADLQRGDAATRHRLALYCWKDAKLPLQLMDKLMVLVNAIEMARVTGVPLDYLLSRGQQIKVVSQLLRAAGLEDLIMPVMDPKSPDGKYEGATVIEPKRGYYDDPIATLDFSSLYPSIMMAHNLCYTTLLNRHDAQALPPAEVTTTPTKCTFVKASTKAGLLPRILAELLAARKRAKKAMKTEKDPFRKGVLNGRQLALKVSANSVYGFTGATVGMLPCLDVSSSVTGFGREMIEHTKNLIESHYTIANGYSHNAVVVYGDTDSVMIKFGEKDMHKVMAMSEEAAALVTATFIKPINLEFEKVYFPYLLISKKRYAGLYWTKPETWDMLDVKGLAVVRRDNCPLLVIVMRRVLDLLLIHKDVPGAIAYVQGVLSRLVRGDIGIAELIITMEYKVTKSNTAQAHTNLVKRMEKRDPGSAPRLGDRVPYVIVRGTKNQKMSERAEDPLFAMLNNIPLDYEYYVEHQLRKPLEQVFEPIMKESVAKLFTGAHMRSIVVPTTSRKSGLAKFLRVVSCCLGCKAPIAEGAAVCDACADKTPVLYAHAIETLQAKEKNAAQFWAHCQRCQGSRHDEILCANGQCPIYLAREKAHIDVQSAHETVARFQLPDW